MQYVRRVIHVTHNPIANSRISFQKTVAIFGFFGYNNDEDRNVFRVAARKSWAALGQGKVPRQ